MATEFLTEKQVSAITKIALSTLRNHRFMGIGIPYYKLGKSVRYNLEDVEKYMDSHKIFTFDSPAR